MFLNFKGIVMSENATVTPYVPAPGYCRVKVAGGELKHGVAIAENAGGKSWQVMVDAKIIQVNSENMFAETASFLKLMAGGTGVAGDAIKALHKKRQDLLEKYKFISKKGLNKLGDEQLGEIAKKCADGTYVPTLYWQDDNGDNTPAVIHVDNVLPEVLAEMYEVAKKYGYAVHQFIPAKRETKPETETAK
jgi:hypothetical protein